MVKSGIPLEPFIEPLPQKDGGPAWALTRKGLVHGADGGVIGVYGISRDITDMAELEAKKAELELENRQIQSVMAQLRNAARMDDLTNLLNHSSTIDSIRSFLGGEGREGLHALFLVDIDNFKAANDQFGHARGDLAISELAGAISEVFRDTDVVGRIGGDEFMVLMENVSDRQAVGAKVCSLLSALQIEVQGGETEVRLSCSAGVAICEDGDSTYDELYGNAEKALYEAKSAGKNRYVIWGDIGARCTGGIAEDSPHKVISAVHTINRWRKVLIADDDTYSQKLLRRTLERNYVVETVPDGLMALNALRDGNYSLLITDIQMPVMTGWDLLNQMKSEEKLRDIPVIIITADDNSESEVKALNMGAMDVIVKPFVAVTLLSRVQNTIARREARIAEEQNRFYEIQLRQQERLLDIAEHDDLTGLYNRKAFIKRAAEIIGGGGANSYVLSCINIDSFKVINDRFGHSEGDRLLKYMAREVLKSDNEHGYLACRDTADVFITLLPNDAEAIKAVTNSQQESVERYELPGRVSVSIGRYVVAEPGVDVNLMIDRAMIAQRSVSGSAVFNIAWYNDEMREKLLRDKEMTDAMRPALESGQFEVWFQPQFEYDSQRMIGAEALVRWRRPGKGLVPPGDFIPLFEKNGFISLLDRYVWEKACQYMRAWLDKGCAGVPEAVSVNISRLDMYNPDLVDILRELVGKYGLPPSRLHLEITESAYMEDPEQLIGIVKELRDDGFTVEMDDFGSGYSSLNTLKEVPVDVLKLDMRFLSSGIGDVVGSKILGAVIGMAHAIDRKAIAEGVETKEQADYLRGLGCRYMQGYYFSKPIPPEEFESIICK